MKHSTVEKAVSFFYPFLKEETKIVFFGGEPLLAFDIVKKTVSLLEKINKKGEKKLTFYLSTNGSLVTDEILQFFHLHGFSLLLSFDGLAQDTGRKHGTLALTRALIPRIRQTGIDFSINCVFTPETAGYFSKSVKNIIEAGGTEIIVSPSCIAPWDKVALQTLEKELDRLTDFLLCYYKEKGIIPVTYFRQAASPFRKGFACTAGRDRISITPGENLWGCFLFHPYLKDKEESSDYRTYSFGKLDDFIENHEVLYPKILSNYSLLKQQYFLTGNRFCFLCEDRKDCKVCPVDAAYATSFIGKIPTWYCSLSRTLRKGRERFLEAMGREIIPMSQ